MVFTVFTLTGTVSSPLEQPVFENEIAPVVLFVHLTTFAEMSEECMVRNNRCAYNLTKRLAS
jgi:hypothetical protein